MDATFKAPKRGAVVVDHEGKRHNVGRGGILSVINERYEIIAWVRTQYISIVFSLISKI